jgi:hypothetical protein
MMETIKTSKQPIFAYILSGALALGASFYAGRQTMLSKVEGTIEQRITMPQGTPETPLIQRLRSGVCEGYTVEQLKVLRNEISNYK